MHKEENRARLIGLIEQIEFDKQPEGWTHVASIATGSLWGVGFSRRGPYLLVVSSAGRGLIDCRSGEKLARDYQEYAGLSDSGLQCQGIGVIADEPVVISGLYGGGLPMSNRAGETLEVVSPDWPQSALILGKPGKHPLMRGHQAECRIIYVEHLRAYGFSWCGNYIVATCGSDLDLWSRNVRL